DTVFSEHQAAIRATVRHLAAQGRRRLALLSLNLRIRPRRERARGFRAAVRAAGLKPDEQHVVLADVAAVHAAVERVLDATPRPDTLLVDGSRMLAATFEILHRRRLAVPGEIAVIAIDAVEPLAAAMPELIGIARDFSEIGRRAAQLMIDRLTGALTGPPVSIVLPSRSLLAEAAADPPALQMVARHNKC
ncbi:MAG: substrate-binding domain-containing protein, partial [Geminicoccaceae bacterium]